MNDLKRRTVAALWRIGVWIGPIVFAFGLMVLIEAIDLRAPWFGLTLFAGAIYLGWIPALVVVLGNWNSD